jgi:AraC family transcriptional activator of pobA
MNNSSASFTDADGSGLSADGRGYVESPIDSAEGSVGILPLKAKHNPRRSHIEPHIHRRFEQLLVVRRGGGKMILEDRQYDFRAPSILVVPSLTVHAFVFEEGTERHVVSLAKKYFQEFMTRAPELAEIFESGHCVTYGDEDRDYVEIERVLSKLEWEQGRTARCREIVTEALLIDLLVCVLRKVKHKPDPAPEPASYREVYKKFVSLVEAHHSEHWTLRQYADALLISVPRLRAICSSVSGESPIRIINTRIVVEAKRCLKYTSLSVAEIAYRLGFDDPSYFSRFFKARCEQTPSEYKVMKGGTLPPTE